VSATWIITDMNVLAKGPVRRCFYSLMIVPPTPRVKARKCQLKTSLIFGLAWLSAQKKARIRGLRCRLIEQYGTRTQGPSHGHSEGDIPSGTRIGLERGKAPVVPIQ